MMKDDKEMLVEMYRSLHRRISAIDFANSVGHDRRHYDRRDDLDRPLHDRIPKWLDQDGSDVVKP